LKDISLHIIEFLESHSNMKIPRLIIMNNDNINTPKIDLDKGNNYELTYSILTLLGVFLIGFGSVIGIMIAGDIIAPDMTRSVPYIGSILDTIYTNFNNVYNWWYNIKPISP
jgi:hypothetical protein